MKKSKANPLRKRAQRVLSERKGTAEKIPSEDVKRLIHELQVHQIELEMQNEELRKAQVEIERSRSRYADLYEFAPIGYYTLDQKGVVKELNLLGAKLLGIERSLIIDRPFQVFIAPEDADIFTQHRLSVLKNSGRQRCELRLVRMDKTSFHASMESIVTKSDTENLNWIRSAITDTTDRIRVEEALRNSEFQLRSLSAQLLTAQEEERRFISEELHDSLGQTLALIELQVSHIRKNLPQQQQDLSDECGKTLQYIRQAIEETRRLSRDLSPSILEDLGLTAALKRLIHDASKYYKVEITLNMESIDPCLSRKDQIILYRIVQEALTNIGKHAQATKVSVSSRIQGNTIFFHMEDNGKGFDVDQIGKTGPINRGMGLAMMKERVRMLGGTLDLRSQVGSGTRISLSIPLQEEGNR